MTRSAAAHAPRHSSYHFEVMDIRACLFDVFGTVVDWRSSVSRDLAAWAKQKGIDGIDWLEFAVEWRKLYQPSMEEVRSGRREFTILDLLHRESLVKLVARYRISALRESGGEHVCEPESRVYRLWWLSLEKKNRHGAT